MPEYDDRGGVIPPLDTPVNYPLTAGEHVVTSTGKVLRFDGRRLVDTGERIDFAAALERVKVVLDG